MEEESAGRRMLEAVQCQIYFGIKLTMKSGKGSLPVEDGNHCWENVIMIGALKSQHSLIAALLHKWRGWQIHLKAIFDISMCHPKVPYHYTFIMTTSRKKSQKFTQTNSKRPSKVKEAGSCLTERRANRVVIHFFLTNDMWQRYRYLSNELITSLKFWREHSNDPLKMHGAKLEAYIKRDGNILPDKVSCQWQVAYRIDLPDHLFLSQNIAMWILDGVLSGKNRTFARIQDFDFDEQNVFTNLKRTWME